MQFNKFLFSAHNVRSSGDREIKTKVIRGKFRHVLQVIHRYGQLCNLWLEKILWAIILLC